MLAYDEKIAYILMQEGMHCIGCPSSIGESLEEACMVHGLDVNAVLADIHHYEETKKQKYSAVQFILERTDYGPQGDNDCACLFGMPSLSLFL